MKQNLINEEKKDIEEIWSRFKKRDFSGNTGMAVKNSIFQMSTNLVAKLGSLIFTIILARLLMPELFGLYSLVLSIVVIFATFSELGISTALIRFISKEFEKKQSRLKSNILYLWKMKAALIFFSSILLIIFADYIANTFYQKPIFLALLAGVLYLIFIQLTAFLQPLLFASNNFTSVFKREIIFQIIRLILVPLAVVLAIKYSLSDEIVLMLIIFFLAIALFLSSIFLFLDVKKSYYIKFKTEKTLPLPKKQKSTLNKFIFATAALAVSGVFFGNIDKVMLGKFVEAEFIGYYTAAVTLISALAPIIAFSAIVLLPIFSRLKGKRLEAGFKKSMRITSLIAVGTFLVTLLFAYFAILIIYGKEYLPATNILRLLSLLLFILPVIAVYQSYYISQGKPKTVAKLLILSTILNIFLNYILITSLLKFGDLAAVYGATIATIISQFFYLGGLIKGRRKKQKQF